MTQNTITSAAQGALMAIHAAELRGLPLPFAVSIDEFSVIFSLNTRDDLAAWSDYLDAPIGSHEFVYEGRRKVDHRVKGELFEQALTLVAQEFAGVSA